MDVSSSWYFHTVYVASMLVQALIFFKFIKFCKFNHNIYIWIFVCTLCDLCPVVSSVCFLISLILHWLDLFLLLACGCWVEGTRLASLSLSEGPAQCTALACTALAQHCHRPDAALYWLCYVLLQELCCTMDSVHWLCTCDPQLLLQLLWAWLCTKRIFRNFLNI